MSVEKKLFYILLMAWTALLLGSASLFSQACLASDCLHVIIRARTPHMQEPATTGSFVQHLTVHTPYAKTSSAPAKTADKRHKRSRESKPFIAQYPVKPEPLTFGPKVRRIFVAGFFTAHQPLHFLLRGPPAAC